MFSEVSHTVIPRPDPRSKPVRHFASIVLTWGLTVSTGWAQCGSDEVKLPAKGGPAGDGFGSAVAISGETLVIGAPLDSFGRPQTRARPMSTDSKRTVGSRIKKLLGRNSDDRFGFSVGIDGDTCVIGAPFADEIDQTKPGTADVFRLFGDQRLWHLHASDLSSGQSVRFVCVSERRHRCRRRSLWQRRGGEIGLSPCLPFRWSLPWLEELKLTPTDAATDDRFGHAVAADGDLIVIGSQGVDGGGPSTGAAYVYPLRRILVGRRTEADGE